MNSKLNFLGLFKKMGKFLKNNSILRRKCKMNEMDEKTFEKKQRHVFNYEIV